jgi:hypothetical protein
MWAARITLPHFGAWLPNTIYATRQNNVLLSVLAQFFGPQPMNRLILIETLSFTTTPDDMSARG